MSSFTSLSNKRLNEELASCLCNKLEALLLDRGDGHCMKVTDLDDEVMELACTELRKINGIENVFILGSKEDTNKPHRITSTKLVELRNPDEGGVLRPCLLVFVPSELRTSAEDSFGVATFEDIQVTTLYGDFIQELYRKIPQPLYASVSNLFITLKEMGWDVADEAAKARYILTAIENGIDGESLGASLYELSLVPDFKLYSDHSMIPQRIRSNIRSVKTLLFSYQSTRGRISELDLNSKTLKNRLIALFERYDVNEPAMWTKVITTDKQWWDVSFDKWTFNNEQYLDKICITDVVAVLPRIPETESNPRLRNIIGEKVLLTGTTRKMNIEFRVEPHPEMVNGLAYFTVQILSLADAESGSGGTVGKAKKVKAWITPNKTKTTVSMTKLNKINFEEEWHIIRVLPWTAEGDPIPMADSSQNNSEPFYVIQDAPVDDDPQPRVLPKDESLEHARLKLMLKAISENRPFEHKVADTTGWVGTDTRRKYATLHISFKGEGVRQIQVSESLMKREQRILSEPTDIASYSMSISLGVVTDVNERSITLHSSPTTAAFLEARKILFKTIYCEPKRLIMQGFDFAEAEQECINYALTYLDMLKTYMKQAANQKDSKQRRLLLMAIKDALTIDTTQVVIEDYLGNMREAILIPPTHPLRLLWIYAWTKLGQNWSEDARSRSLEYIPEIRTTLLEKIRPTAFPMVASVPGNDSRLFALVDDINTFWALYAPTTESNTRGLLAEVCNALGLPAPSDIGSDINGDVIGEKIERYLTQHPYIKELSINIFNPGTGIVIADALLALQHNIDFKDLRYNIHLFAPDPESPLLGEDIEFLLRPDTTVKEAADAFTTSRGSHLFSKLRLAKHKTDDFSSRPDKYTAHISIIIDEFPAGNYSTENHAERTVPVYGMVQSFETLFTDDDSSTMWQQKPIIGLPMECEEVAEHNIILSELAKTICYATAAIATDGANFHSAPVAKLALSGNQRKLIYEVHQVSDWVFIIDRYMGIEFFDHGGFKDRPEYLIDYVPSSSSNSSHNLIITSRSSDEIKTMLEPIAQKQGIRLNAEQSSQIVAFLRSLSGQLALKLISAETQQTEAFGLALARLYLEYQGALEQQIILPLDAHTDWYRTAKENDGDNSGISLQRTDLALFDLNYDEKIMTCRLVEVKCYNRVGDIGRYNALKESISEQIYQSERIIQRHYDPLWKQPDRPDRLWKSHEIEQILRFYLERSIRYQIIDEEAAQEARSFLDNIEDGYSLQFSRSAIIFDFDKDGLETENETGIEYHRIGRDKIQALLDDCRHQKTQSTSDECYTKSSLNETVVETVPKLDTAAYLAPVRKRSTANIVKQAIPDEVEIEEKKKTKEYESPEELPESKHIIPEENIAPDENVKLRVKESDKIYERQELQVQADTKQSSEALAEPPQYDIILGVTDNSPQYGLLGEVSGRKVALDLNHTNTISLFGVQGGGKSYTLGTVIEMALMPVENINLLPNPLATVVFHYSPTQDYAPEYTSMINANSVAKELELLQQNYSAQSCALRDVTLLTPSSKLEERREEYPDIEVLPISFAASELKVGHWKFLMGAVGNQSMYMRQINQIMRGLRSDITLTSLRNGISAAQMSDNQKEIALTRLSFAAEYINDEQRLQDIIRPGRLIIVDLRDEFIEKDEALGLFVVMLQIISEATFQGNSFNKLVVFDEAHKYIENDDLVTGLVEVVREMRHKGTSIMVASQDPPSVPIPLIELSSQIILHKFNSPSWLKHIQKANTSLSDLTSDKMGKLGTGQAYVWSSKATDDAFSRGTVKIQCRPRVTQHGGSTKTAVAE